MPSRTRYPRMNMGSKNELAKRIAGKKLPFADALQLINDALAGFDGQWYDSASSEPEKDKWVRSAVGTPLGRVLSLVDKKVLAPYDELIPDFIFGGVSGRSHVKAVAHLLGNQRQRVLLGLDITKFFEQIHEDRVFNFFCAKASCNPRVARLLARLCCVARGPKEKPEPEKSLARGFATSPRLALWCNLDTFLKLDWAMKKRFHGHDPRIAIYVDDIGITASRVDKADMEAMFLVAKGILENADHRQKLPLNQDKKKVRSSAD